MCPLPYKALVCVEDEETSCFDNLFEKYLRERRHLFSFMLTALTFCYSLSCTSFFYNSARLQTINGIV